jgi:hypothetical protein
MSKQYAFHPLADIFPLMQGEEFDALVADINANGLRERIDKYRGKIVDGRNRYRALLQLGIDPSADEKKYFRNVIYRHPMGGGFAPCDDASVLAYVVSKNIHRRHLTADQKRDLIAKLIKAEPTKSNRQIGKQVVASHPHVAKVRAEMEKTSDVETVTTSVDTKGRKQPAKKPTKKAGRKQSVPKPVKHDDRVISPELGERVGRLAHRLVRLDVDLARELVDLILQRGVAERLWADLDTGIKIEGNNADPASERAL